MVKEKKLVVKDSYVKVSEKDYRAFLAVLLVVSFIAALFVDNEEAIAALGPLAGSAITWYFGKRRKT